MSAPATATYTEAEVEDRLVSEQKEVCGAVALARATWQLIFSPSPPPPPSSLGPTKITRLQKELSAAVKMHREVSDELKEMKRQYARIERR